MPTDREAAEPAQADDLAKTDPVFTNDGPEQLDAEDSDVADRDMSGGDGASDTGDDKRR